MYTSMNVVTLQLMPSPNPERNPNPIPKPNPTERAELLVGDQILEVVAESIVIVAVHTNP